MDCSVNMCQLPTQSKPRMANQVSPRKGALPVPATKRMAALRDRRRKAGMTPMEVWAHPDDHQAIRDEAARLAKARDEAANAEVSGAGTASAGLPG